MRRIECYFIFVSIRAVVTRFFIRLLNRLTFSTVGFRWKSRLLERLPAFPPPPAGSKVTRFRAGALPARWIVPPGPLGRDVILYIHGGGWIYGWMFLYDGMVGRLAAACGARAFGFSYRLAPECPYPAALEDSLSAYRFLLDSGISHRDVVFMGDSAGANLALVLMLTCRLEGLPLPKAAVCLSPPTDLSSPGPTYSTNRVTDALLSVSFARLALSAYAGGRDARDPLLSPLYADLRGLPALLIQAGGGELLLSDAVRFAGRAREAGVPVTLQVYPGMWHVFQLSNPDLPESRRAFREIGRFVRSLPA
ncbi:MAG: alpha/beta hydrolase [Spirochaetales bacterium]|nr:alpha/beta hydrolase [Spirochaetales bacterium]